MQNNFGRKVLMKPEVLDPWRQASSDVRGNEL